MDFRIVYQSFGIEIDSMCVCFRKTGKFGASIKTEAEIKKSGATFLRPYCGFISNGSPIEATFPAASNLTYLGFRLPYLVMTKIYTKKKESTTDSKSPVRAGSIS